jgi:VanZ family protein
MSNSKPGLLRVRTATGFRFESRSKALKYWTSVWLPVVIGMILIAIESTEAFGANHTSEPLRRVWEALFGAVTNPDWDVIHHIIRKCGHFFAYGFIGLAWLRAWWLTLPNSRFFMDAGLALLGTCLIATCDEFHQTFLPNRTGSAWDVLLDCSGALVLELIVYLFVRTFHPKHLARAA